MNQLTYLELLEQSVVHVRCARKVGIIRGDALVGQLESLHACKTSVTDMKITLLNMHEAMNMFIVIMNIIIPAYEYYVINKDSSMFKISISRSRKEMGTATAAVDAFHIDHAPCAVSQF